MLHKIIDITSFIYNKENYLCWKEKFEDNKGVARSRNTKKNNIMIKMKKTKYTQWSTKQFTDKYILSNTNPTKNWDESSDVLCQS